MKKYFSVFLVLCSLFIYSNTQAQSLLENIIKAGQADNQAALQKRLREGHILAPTLIPQAKIQSQLGPYLIDQLYIKIEAEKNKQKRRSIQRDIRKIEKDLDKLDAGILSWEKRAYSTDLAKLTATFSKHTRKYKNIVEVLQERLAAEEAERERIAAEEKAEQERIAAEEKAEQERIAAEDKAEQERIAAEEKAERERKLAAFIERCEPGSDDPFAAFNAAREPRMDLVLKIGINQRTGQPIRMKLQATKNGNCMWLGNYDRSDVVPALVTEGKFQQNPNNKTQYSLDIDTDGKKPAVTTISNKIKFAISIPGSFILDFENYRCALVKQDGSQQQISCDDGSVAVVADPNDPSQLSCPQIMQQFEFNATAAAQRLGAIGMVRWAECLAE
jgi:hypothetical protein